TVDATERLFKEDTHFYDGIMGITEGWMFHIDADTAISPSPPFPIDEKTLNNRFDTSPWGLVYWKHQRDDAFWHEPVKPLSSIHIPVLVIGGWLDTFTPTIPRFLQELTSPV